MNFSFSLDLCKMNLSKISNILIHSKFPGNRKDSMITIVCFTTQRMLAAAHGLSEWHLASSCTRIGRGSSKSTKFYRDFCGSSPLALALQSFLDIFRFNRKQTTRKYRTLWTQLTTLYFALTGPWQLPGWFSLVTTETVDSLEDFSASHISSHLPGWAWAFI